MKVVGTERIGSIVVVRQAGMIAPSIWQELRPTYLRFGCEVCVGGAEMSKQGWLIVRDGAVDELSISCLRTLFMTRMLDSDWLRCRTKAANQPRYILYHPLWALNLLCTCTSTLATNVWIGFCARPASNGRFGRLSIKLVDLPQPHQQHSSHPASVNSAGIIYSNIADESLLLPWRDVSPFMYACSRF